MNDPTPHHPRPFESKPEIEIEVRVLKTRMSLLAQDQTVSYVELSELLGRDLQSKSRTAFRRARDQLQREKQMVFQCEEGIQIRRLTDIAILATSPKKREHIRRTSVKNVAVLSCVKFEELTDERKIKHNAEMAAMGVIALFSRHRDHRRLLEVTGTQNPLPVGMVLALFQSKEKP